MTDPTVTFHPTPAPLTPEERSLRDHVKRLSRLLGPGRPQPIDYRPCRLCGDPYGVECGDGEHVCGPCREQDEQEAGQRAYERDRARGFS